MCRNYSLLVILWTYSILGAAQLSEVRWTDMAAMKVERFQNILDLTAEQSVQLTDETLIILQAQGNMQYHADMLARFDENLDAYYTQLTTLKPQQLATLKVMNSLERHGRNQAYEYIVSTYQLPSALGLLMTAYQWNVIIPVLVSYRKDLETSMAREDKLYLLFMREKMINKYNFIHEMREQQPSAKTESLVSHIQQELAILVQDSGLSRLWKKYEKPIRQIQVQMQSEVGRIQNDLRMMFVAHVDVADQYPIDEEEFISTFGFSNLMKDEFFLLLDGESRSLSFKINALYTMTKGESIAD